MLDSVQNVNNSRSCAKSAFNSPFDKFSGIDFSSNKTYLSSIYSSHKINFYNDLTEKKNKKIKNTLLIGSVGFALLSALLLALKGRAINKTLRPKVVGFGNSVKEKTLPAAKKTTSDLAVFSLNAANIKDDAWDRFSEFLYNKTPFKFVKKFGELTTGFYQKNIYKATKKQFLNAQKEIIEAPGGEKFKDSLKDFDKMFDNLNSKFKQKARQERISSLNGLFGGKERNFKNLYTSLTTPMVRTKLDEIIKNNANVLDIPEGADIKLAEKIQNYNKLQQNCLIPKLAEVSYGSAPTDFILNSIPVVGFGIALLKTPDKKERESLMFNLGIPLLPTVAMPLLGTIYPALNGFKAMVAGFAVGQIFSQGVKAADKFLFKKNNEADNPSGINQ